MEDDQLPQLIYYSKSLVPFCDDSSHQTWECDKWMGVVNTQSISDVQPDTSQMRMTSIKMT
jgi:hypothetical protein